MYLAELAPEEREKEVQRLFRKVFDNPEGKIVFTLILQELRYFTPPENDREEGLRSFAGWLIDQCITADSLAIVQALFALKEDSHG